VRPSIASLSAALALCVPEAAMACSVCFSATDQNRMAFLGTTIFLSLLPLLLIGGVGVVVWKRSRTVENEETP